MTRISEKKGVSPVIGLRDEVRQLRDKLSLTEKERDDLKARVASWKARAEELAEQLEAQIDQHLSRGRWRDLVKKYPLETGAIVAAVLAVGAVWVFLA